MNFNSYTLTFLLFFSLFTTVIVHAQSPEKRLTDLEIELPEVTKPVANYVSWRKTGNLLFLAGKVSNTKGKLGKDITIEEGYQAARSTGVKIIAILKAACGDLSKIKQFIKVDGMVQSTPDFYDQSKVMNGFSDLMVDVFGEKGKHARSGYRTSSTTS